MSRFARPPLTAVALEDRVVPAAALDPAFGAAGKAVFDFGPADEILAVAAQPDGKIVLAGATSNSPIGPGDFVVARLNADGSLDKSFDGDGVRTLDFGGRDIAYALALQPDGKIVVAGAVYDAETDAIPYSGPVAELAAVARLNLDGSDDLTFGPNGRRTLDLNGGADNPIHAITLGPTGLIYLAGGRNRQPTVARLTPSGDLDPTFGTGGVKAIDLGGTSMAQAVSLMADGRVVLAGYTDAGLNLYPGGPYAPFADGGGPFDMVAVRLAADGSAVDFGFGNVVLNGNKAALVQVGSAHDSSSVAAAVLRPDGSLLLIGGGTAGGSEVVRLTPAGQLDVAFNGTGHRVLSIGAAGGEQAAVRPDGRVVVAAIVSENGASDVALAQLSRDGSDDPTFGGVQTIDLRGPYIDYPSAVGVDALGRVVVAGRTEAGVAVAALAAEVPAKDVLLASGTPDGKAVQYVAVGGKYIVGPGFAGFPGDDGPVRAAAVDVTGDGVPERVVGVGPGGAPWVEVFDGRTGLSVGGFFAFESSFTGGVLLAGGDFNGDGRAELVVTADVGGGPRVRVLDGASLTGEAPVALADFFGIADTAFRGGARPAVGDVNSDGTVDLIVAAGPGGGPRVAVFDGQAVAAGSAAPGRLVADFFAFEPGLRNGAFPASGDVDSDGFADLVFGAGPGGAPRVLVVGGEQLLAAGPVRTVDETAGLALASFFAGDPNSRAGVTVTTRPGTGRADVATGSGPGLRSEVRLYRGATVLGGDPVPDQVLDPFGATIAGGVYVG